MNRPALDQLKIDRGPEREPGGNRAVGIAVVVALVVAAMAVIGFYPRSAAEVRTATVQSVGGEASGTVLNASGYVNARRQATVSSEMTGKVTEVLIEEGMAVEEGQVLARLDDANIRASFDLADAQRRAVITSLAETEALLREARANLERARRLVERKLASQADLDRALAQAEGLEAQLERGRAEVEVAERNLGVWQQQLEDTVIRAPFSGVVVAKNAQPGEMISPVSAGGGFTRTGIGTLVDMDSLEIEIDVNEAYINRVTPGQRAIATLDAYPDWPIPCSVIAIIPTADRQRATVEVRVGLDELDPRILPDMGVKVAFQDERQGDAPKRRYRVPARALHRDGERDVVFVVRDGVLERRAVAVAERREDIALLASGVEAGERVVVSGPAELAAGMKVKEL